jgi:hypothetical protein
VDASNGKLVRWNVALPPIAGAKVNGFVLAARSIARSKRSG